MNCAESQDLLLDLAYGELEPARAAEVEEHVQGCAACRAEKSQLDLARKLAAPLREMEEPPANFDEPIVRAARAEAGMQADGTPGPVVEVAASVKPLGLQATRLDPHAKVRSEAPRVAWWRRRTAVFGSVAAAAAVVVVAVSLSLSQGRRGRVAPVEVAPITVRAPNAVVPEALNDALARNDKREAAQASPGSNSLSGSRAASPVAPERKTAPAQDGAPPKAEAKVSRLEERADLPKAAAKSVAPSAGPAEPEERKTKGAGGVVGGVLGGERVAAKRSTAATEGGQSISMNDRSSYGASEADARTAPAAAAPAATRADADRAPARAPEAAREATPAAPPGAGIVATAAQPRDEAAAQRAKAPARSADALEDDASGARRSGNYQRAAALYREAATLRKDSDPQRAAWDMAHAVECLAAGGNVAEAVAVRKDLLQSFPDQQGPRAAANAALRSVPLPSDEDTPPGK